MANPKAKIIEDNARKLKAKLRELFQLDRGDLDFGLYRIMALKSAEISDFLENKLLPQVSSTLGDIAKSDTALFEKRLGDAKGYARDLHIDPESAPKIQELKAQVKAAKSDEQKEADTYNHLCSFFSRYYDEGDFMSLRRYKSAGREAYSIPYNGEEIKLHWANADQYYIKTTENYASYVFKVGENGKERRVRFEIAMADNEKDNVKEADGKQRFFVLAKDFIAEEKNRLTVRFDHRPLKEGEKKKHPQNGVKRQASINEETEQRIFLKIKKMKGDWRSWLAFPCPTEADENRTLLGKHLAAYTAKNSFDYFIHKDLGGFLRRELDHYLKSEVISIDNLDLAADPIAFIRGVAQIKTVRIIGHKIIDFLAQLEDFQKKLWLKKKFVLETQYCVTLDKVPRSLYAEIVKNKAQHNEWVKLFAIDKLKGDLVKQTAYSKPLKPRFLQENPYLVLDTRHFDKRFTDNLLAALSDVQPLEEQMDGLLVHGENFQALNLLQERYRGQVQCVYIDPPFNTKSSQILYKNDHKRSSWLSMMENRLSLGKNLMSVDGVKVIAIDEVEQERLGRLISIVFPEQVKTCVTVVHNPAGQQGSNFSYTNEFAYFIYPSKKGMIGFENRAKPDVRPLRNASAGSRLRTDAANCFYPIYAEKGEIAGFGSVRDADLHPQSRAEHNFIHNTVWIGPQYSANSHGSVVLKNIIPNNEFDYPKSINTVINSVDASLKNKPLGAVLDYFAGSGTTGHAVINLNREDDGDRKYILVEVGRHFDTVLLPRIKKVIYSKEWKDGEPKDRKGVSQLFKYIRLESYEDVLDSLSLNPRGDLLAEEKDKAVAEDYHLRYALGEETANSASLLGKDFIDPFNYTLSVVRDGARREVKADLVETFNFLIGLRPAARRLIDGVLAVTGTNANGKNCMILWRNLKKTNATKLDKWFTKHRKALGDGLELIYVNGDHTLNALRKSGDKWEAITMEPVFKKLMFGEDEQA